MATVKVRYVGPFDEVSVPLGDGEYLTVARNHQAEVPAALAGDEREGLLAQPDNWQRVGAASRARTDGDGDKEG